MLKDIKLKQETYRKLEYIKFVERLKTFDDVVNLVVKNHYRYIQKKEKKKK